MTDPTETQISMPKELRDRFHDAKPFDSITHREWLEHLLDFYEGNAEPVIKQSIPRSRAIKAAQKMHEIENAAVGPNDACTSVVAKQQESAREAREILEEALQQNTGDE